jgi:hypothetical protein
MRYVASPIRNRYDLPPEHLAMERLGLLGVAGYVLNPRNFPRSRVRSDMTPPFTSVKSRNYVTVSVFIRQTGDGQIDTVPEN